MNRFVRASAVYVGITLATLIFLELSLRAYDIATGHVVFDDLLKSSATRMLYPHPFLQYTSSRNFHGLVTHLEPGVKFWTTTNSSGFRTHELYPKAPGRVRVLMLGDSFTYGSNANDYETTHSVLEGMLRQSVSPEVEVISLGVPSYSGVRYAILARLYFEYLRPDVVIVAVDSSDYEEDVTRIGDYMLDEDGYPLILKQYRTLEDTTTPQSINFTRDRTMIVGGVGAGRLLALREGSALFNTLWTLKQDLGTQKIAAEFDPQDFSTLTPDQYRRTYCGTAPKAEARRRAYCFDLPAMLDRYVATRNSLEYVKKKADAVGAITYFSSYPYPWFAQLNRSLAHQEVEFDSKVQLDFRSDHAFPQLLEHYAADLGATHLNAYPIFSDAAVNYWGNVDPHFNSAGYRRYASFLHDSIKAEVQRRLPQTN